MSSGRKIGLSSVPERRCIATGSTRPSSAMVRFTVNPDGFVVPDIANKLPGRGAWISSDEKALVRAVTRNQFARTFEKNVRIPSTLASDVEALLAKRVIELLSIARKAGIAVAGYEKVKESLNTGTLVLLLQASDGSPRQKSRINRRSGPSEFVGCLSASEIGIAFGRNRVIHAALATGKLTLRIADEAQRLAGFRVETCQL